MLRAIGCAIRDLDLGLAARGCLICLLASRIGLRLLVRTACLFTASLFTGSLCTCSRARRTAWPDLVPLPGPVTRATTIPAGATLAACMMASWRRRAVTLASACLAFGLLAIALVPPASAATPTHKAIDATADAASRTTAALVAVGGVLVSAAFALGIAIRNRRTAGRLTDELHRLRRLADATFEGLIFERNGIIIDTNPAMCKLMGIENGTLTAVRLDKILRHLTLQSAPNEPTEHELHRCDGETRFVEVLWRNNPDEGGRVIAVRDLTHEKAEQLRIQRMALFDALTGLPNRDQFEYHLRNALAPTARVALLYIDLDRFDTVFEMLGSAGTDEVLVRIAQRLTDVARDAGLVARIGQDEFAVIQALDSSEAPPAGLASTIVAALAQPIDIDGHMFAVTASVGMAVYPTDGTKAGSLFKSAATALRSARQEGRGRWTAFTPEVELRQQNRLRMEKELSVALAEGQLSVHYQAFYHADSLEVGGCEALLRWNHPTRGRVSPAEFIPIAEETGLIVPIGEWVLKTACAEAARWDRPLTIAVNLSPVQFSHASIVEDVAGVLACTGLSPERLELEITETTVMTDAPNAARILAALKGLGVRIAMDDFGTGHSSLGNLRKFPFDKIKIDRSFISDDDSDAETIVQTIIAMGQGLSLTVTAEGVETSRQMAMLRRHGCTYVQGFLLARPAPASQLDLSPSRHPWMKTVALPSVIGGSVAVPASGLSAGNPDTVPAGAAAVAGMALSAVAGPARVG